MQCTKDISIHTNIKHAHAHHLMGIFSVHVKVHRRCR